MDAYEQIRDDVLANYRDVARRDGRDGQEGREGIASTVVPGVAVSASQPAWLGKKWRAAVVVSALVGSAAGLVLMWWVVRQDDGQNSSAPWVGVAAGLFAIVALIVAYLTVGGFGEATFSVGQNSDQQEPPPVEDDYGPGG
jgi:hypothetical protein